MYRSIVLLASLALASLSVQADVVHLSNGDRLSGRLVSLDGSAALFDPDWGEPVRIPREAVQSIETDEVLGVELQSEDAAEVLLVTTDAGEQGVRAADGRVREIGFGAVELAYRETPRQSFADEFRLNASYGLNISSGNADTQTHSIRSDLLLRLGVQRHKTKLEVDRKLVDDTVTKDQRRLGHQLDWFFRDDWYGYGSAEYFADDIKDVSYRFTVGAGVGHQFWDNSLGGLSAEAGASVVLEEIGGEAEENPAVRAALDYNRFYFGGLVELFHEDELLALTDLDRGLILNTSTGLRLQISDRWKADARVDLVYETEPAAGNEKADVTYILGIVYSM